MFFAVLLFINRFGAFHTVHVKVVATDGEKIENHNIAL
tara:strand:+ start:342 stop:455 length:114 start_codon:yes stop_codon:yes gene_type:complete